MLLYFILITIGFFILIKGADLLVKGASLVAKKLNVSDLVIGLTVIAFGTSAPELFVNIFASIKGSSGIAIGNVLGSNIANIFLILGVSAVILPLPIGETTSKKEIPFNIFAVLILVLTANNIFIKNTSSISIDRIDGFIFLFFFCLFMFYSFNIAKKTKIIPLNGNTSNKSLFKSIFFIIIGFAGLFFGGNLIVENSINLAEYFSISETAIGVTIVALGTSLPELAVSVTAVLKRKFDIAVGNVIGSNIFNIFFVLGISSLIKPISLNKSINFDITLVFISSLFLLFSIFTGRKNSIDRKEGVIFLVIYIFYITISFLKS